MPFNRMRWKSTQPADLTGLGPASTENAPLKDLKDMFFFRPILWNGVPIDRLLVYLEQTRNALVMCRDEFSIASAKWPERKLVGDGFGIR
jgi:hypothetical protein